MPQLHPMERRWFGGMRGDDSSVPSAPSTLVASATGDYYVFDERLAVNVHGEALVFDLASRRWEEMVHLVSLDRLLALTTAAAWSISGQQGSPVDFDSIDARVIDEVGATHVVPVIADKSCLFVRAKGTGARALAPADKEGGYEGVDISQVAKHLFVGPDRVLVDWCLAEDPWGVVWAVRRDGQLLSLTYTRQGWGWARHDTNGVFESICAVPEGDEDAVYVVVRRGINGVDKRYLERLTSRHSRAPEDGSGAAVLDDGGTTITTPPDYICLDSATACLNNLAGGAPGALTGLEHLEGEEVYVIGQSMSPIGPLTVDGGELSLDGLEDQFIQNVTCLAGGFNLVHVGMLYTPELETLDVSEARMATKVVERVGIEVDQSIGLEAGQDFDNLAEWEARDVEDGYSALTPDTVLINQTVEGTWSQTGRAVVRQTQPLPVTVVGLIREVTKGT